MDEPTDPSYQCRGTGYGLMRLSWDTCRGAERGRVCDIGEAQRR